MRIGEVAKLSGISASTLRYYERVGLVNPPRRVSGQRQYSEDILGKLRLIQLAKQLSFSLDDIRELLNDDTKIQSQADMWREVASQKLVDIQQQIAQYQSIEKNLVESINCDCIDLATCDLIA